MLEKHDFVILSFKIIANSKEFKFAGLDGEKVRLKVKNPAFKGKANKEIVKELENIFDTEVEIIKGLYSNNKEIKIYKNKELVLEIIRKLIS